MTIKNAIRIGKGIGKFLELDTNSSGNLICRQFIQFRVDVNVLLPFAPGFYLSRPGFASHWIAFKYERLDEYCIACRLIGLKKSASPAPQILDPPEKYDLSLRPTTSSGPQLVTPVPSEDSDSGLSFAASVGNSLGSIDPMHAYSSSNKNMSQLVPHVHTENSSLLSMGTFSQALLACHVDSDMLASDLQG